MPSSVSKVQRNDEIAKQHVLQEWNLPFLLNQCCFSQSFGLCWLQLPTFCRYKIQRDQELRAVGGGNRRSSKPRLLLAAILPCGYLQPVAALQQQQPVWHSGSASGWIKQASLLACSPVPMESRQTVWSIPQQVLICTGRQQAYQAQGDSFPAPRCPA